MSLNPDLVALFSNPRIGALLGNQSQLSHGNSLQLSNPSLLGHVGSSHVRAAGRELALINSQLQFGAMRGHNGQLLSLGDLEKNSYKGYSDYSRVPEDDTEDKLFGNDRSVGKAANCANFPMKLHEILSREEFSSIIAWAPHGRSWRVLKPKTFESKVLPQFFRHGKYNSFTRQVNGWGFRRITQGPDHNTYYHEFFLRGLPHLCKKMRRVTAITSKVSDSGVKYPEPDFYRISEINPLPENGGNGSLTSGLTNEVNSSSREDEVYTSEIESQRDISTEALQRRINAPSLATILGNVQDQSSSIAASLSALHENCHASRLAGIQQLLASDRSRLAAQELLFPYGRGLGAQALQGDSLLRLQLEAASANLLERESLISAVQREQQLLNTRSSAALENLILMRALQRNSRNVLDF